MQFEWGPLITIVIFMVVHLCGTVWWMSKIQTTLGYLADNVKEIMKTVTAHEATYAKKEDQAREFAYRDKQIEAIWKKLDSPHTCPNNQGKIHERMS